MTTRYQQPHARLVEALGAADKAARWLAKRNQVMGGQTPEALPETADGLTTDLQILCRIEHVLVSSLPLSVATDSRPPRQRALSNASPRPSVRASPLHAGRVRSSKHRGPWPQTRSARGQPKNDREMASLLIDWFTEESGNL